MAQEHLDTRTVPTGPGGPGSERTVLAGERASSAPRRASPPPDMHLRALLNGPVPSTHALGPPAELGRPPQGVRPSAEAQHRLTGLARPHAPHPGPGWQPSVLARPPLKVEATAPPPASHLTQNGGEAQGQRLPVAKLLYTRSAASVLLSVQDMCDFVRKFSNAEDLNIRSGRAVSTSYNSQEPALRARLWTDWHIFSTLARSLGVPVFPIQPAKVALVLAAHAELPISPVLRELARLGTAHDPTAVPTVFDALNLAAKATRHLWTDVACFVRTADSYEATAVLSTHIHELTRASSSRPADAFYDRPAPHAAHLERPPHPPSRDSFTSRPLLTNVPPAAPPPAFVTPPPDQFIQPAHGESKQVDKSLRSLCEDLPGLLKDLQKEADDLATFELAQDRFQKTVNTPDYASRVARLHHTAVIYTHVTALLRFPTYPITSRKLAVFALAMTPGPLGLSLDAAAPTLKDERQCPRAPKGKTLEDILQDLTLVRSITMGDRLTGPERAEWARWWKEVTDDWKGRGKGKSKMRDERPAAPAAKRIKRSASPDSDASAASTSRLPGGTKKATTRQPRSRMSLTEPSSRASSPAVTGRAPRAPGQKKGYAYIPTTPAVVYPRFVPERKGTLPKERREPALPPIMDSPWFVPRKKKALAAAAAGGRAGSVAASAAGSAGGGVGGAEGEGGAESGEGGGASDEEDEEEQKRALGRSVALHRPRRGGLDMKPFDVSILWD